MTDLSQSLDLIAASDTTPVPADEADVEIVIDPNHLAKAKYVIRQLKAAGLKTTYDFDVDEAAAMWAGYVGGFSASVLDESIREWIADSGGELPDVGEFTALCQYIVTERMRMSAEADAKAREQTQCTECGTPDEVDEQGHFIPGHTLRWVRVEDNHGSGHHFRPCSQCLPERYQLYMEGCFDKEHTARGGCPKCVEYHKPWLTKSKKKAKARSGGGGRVG